MDFFTSSITDAMNRFSENHQALCRNHSCPKILSIDYDFFQQVNADTLCTCYPDGVDLPTSVTIATWVSYYANERQKRMLEAVTVNEQEFALAKKIICNQDIYCPVMVANSHRHIYDFICDNFSMDDELILVNADMHHDFINEEYDVNCGNWVSHVLDMYDESYFCWIANPVSKKVFDFEKDKDKAKLIPETLKVIADWNFDAIFLCRSDTWTPPHLDDKFAELYKTIRQHFDETVVERSIETPREYLSEAEKVKEFFRMNGIDNN